MARRVADLKGDITKGELLTVGHWVDSEVGMAFGPEGDEGAGCCGELEVS